jgi:hypothetical protein
MIQHNVIMRPKVTFTTNYYRGGLGDFFNGAISLFALVRDVADFQIWLPKSLPLADCFDLTSVKPSGRQILLDATGETMVDAPRQAALVRNLIKEGNDLTVITNIGTFVPSSALVVAVPSFMELFKPSAAVDRRRSELLGLAGVHGEYISLHVRCGDGYSDSPNCYCPGDRRLDPDMAFAQLLSFVCDLKDDLPIIFHTDNLSLRERCRASIPELLTLDVSIQHTAEPGGSCIDTVAEFFIVGGAKKIYYMVDSGFTRMPSLLFGVERQQI